MVEGQGQVVKDAREEPRREKFIPVTRRSLVRRLGEEENLLNWQEREKLETFASALDARFSQRLQGLLEETKVWMTSSSMYCQETVFLSQYLYDVMDPDKDTVVTRQLNRKQLLDTERQLLLQVERLLEKANYFQVSPSLIPDIADQSHHTGPIPSPKISMLQYHLSSGPAPSVERFVKRSRY